VDAVGLVTGPADLAGVVGGEERTDHELAGLDRGDLGAGFFDDADVFVAHRGGLLDGVDAAVVPQVGPAHAGGGHADDRVGGVFDSRVGSVFESDVTGGINDCAAHSVVPF
jgi:hypothetical protein